MPWDPNPNPFPAFEIEPIADFRFHDELRFVRHRHAPATAPDSWWQLSADFRVSMILRERGAPPDQAFVHEITAPRGMYTDLSSVPPSLWSIVGPIGRHLEASIVHDYLYMAWTDFRPLDQPSRQDRRFADDVLLAGMLATEGMDPELARDTIYRTVRLAGWWVFKEKDYRLSERMEVWLGDL